jgi:hypothetical protein
MGTRLIGRIWGDQIGGDLDGAGTRGMEWYWLVSESSVLARLGIGEGSQAQSVSE